MKKTWYVSDNNYFLQDVTSEVKKLEPGIYNLQSTPQGQLFLARVSDRFEFDFKIYGMESDFISRVIKTYDNTTGNMGILLNGIKGTGKTVTAEIIANRLKLPIILIGTVFGGMNNFLMNIPQDLVIFIDEYEKTFKGNIEEDDEDSGDGNSKGDSSLLSLMDGALKTSHRKVFLLTTNRRWINDNMLNRPGRIKYVKDFQDLELGQINEIIEDCLINKRYKEDIVSYLKPLKIITVDIVKAVISQVNIFDEAPVDACKNLNVEMKEDEFEVYEIKSGKEKIFDETPDNSTIRYTIARGKAAKGSNMILNNDYYYVIKVLDIKDKIYQVSPSNRTDDTITIKIKKAQPVHRVFGAM